MDAVFKNAERYIMNFKPYLQSYYDNLNIDYDIVMDEKLK